MKFRKIDNVMAAGWRVIIGGCNGQAFRVELRYFKGTENHRRGFRLMIDLNGYWLINLFGFNHKIIGC